MTYAEQRKYTENSEYQTRVKIAVLKAAAAILGESAAALGANEATKRHDLAFAALMGGDVCGTNHSPSDIEDKFLWLCTSYYTPDQLDSDAKVDTAVSSLWDDLAGVKLAE